MNWDNSIGDIVAVTACLFALYYVFRIYQAVHAPSRAVLLAGMLYMVTTRLVIFALELAPGATWIETHRSIIIVPQYVLFAVAFGMTYHELKTFSFGVPQSAEARDTEEKHEARMDAQMPADREEGEA